MLAHRLIAVPSSIGEAKTCLSSQESVFIDIRQSDSKGRTIGIGIQWSRSSVSRYGEGAYENSVAFREHVDKCNFIALSLGLPNLVEVICPTQIKRDPRNRPSIKSAKQTASVRLNIS